MSWVAVDKDGTEWILESEPRRGGFLLYQWESAWMIELPKGSIKKLIGRDLTWDDDCVELK